MKALTATTTPNNANRQDFLNLRSINNASKLSKSSQDQGGLVFGSKRSSIRKTISMRSSIMMEYGDFTSQGLKNIKSPVNPITQPRHIRTTKAHYHKGAGLTETSSGQVISRIKQTQIDKKKALQDEIREQLRVEDQQLAETVQALRNNQLVDYMEGYTQGVNFKLGPDINTINVDQEHLFKSPDRSVYADGYGLKVKSHSNILNMMSSNRPFSATVQKPRGLATMRRQTTDQKSQHSIKKRLMSTINEDRGLESTKLDSNEQLSQTKPGSLISFPNMHSKGSRVGSAITVRTNTHNSTLNQRLLSFQNTLSSPMNLQSQMTTPPYGNLIRESTQDIINVKSGINLQQMDTLNIPSEGRVSFWKVPKQSNHQNQDKHIIIDDLMLGKTEQLNDSYSYDNQESHIDFSDQNIQINLIQSAATDILKISKFKGIEDTEKIQRIQNTYNNLLQKIKYKAKPRAIYGIIKSQGDILIEYRELHEAIISYKVLKNFCEEMKLYREKMCIYSQLGYCYRIVRSHAVAVDYFKKQLEIAWQVTRSSYLQIIRDLKNQTAEMQAYDNIAMEYFYMGDVEKAKFYQDRMLRGKLENKDSIIRSVCINILQSKRDKVHSGQKKLTVKKEVFDKIDEERMADYGHSKAYQLMPHFSENLDSSRKKKMPTPDKKDKNGDTDLEEYDKYQKQQELEKREEIQKQRAAKVSVVRSNITVKTLRKNKEKYDIQRLKKDQMSNYQPFEEKRFVEMVRKAHQRQMLGEDIQARPEAFMGHQSILRTMPLHAVNQQVQSKNIEEIVFNMLLLVQKIIHSGNSRV